MDRAAVADGKLDKCIELFGKQIEMNRKLSKVRTDPFPSREDAAILRARKQIMNGKIKYRLDFSIYGAAVLGILLMVGCDRQPNTATSITELPPFSITNRFAGGELRQMIQITNGMTLCFTRSNIAVGFCPGAFTLISFDPETRKPLSVLLETPPSASQPAQSVLDLNADGIPDIRQVQDGSNTRQVFYRGEWYTSEAEGTNIVIVVNGKKWRMHFDGRCWIEVSTNEGVGP